MPKLSSSVPKYRKHRASGQAVVTIAGRDHYLGPHGTKASKLEYDRLVMEWLAAGRPASCAADEGRETTVTELIAAYWKFVQQYYRKDGEPTGSADRLKPVLRTVRELYGDKPVTEIRPIALEALQRKWIGQGHSRTYINMNTGRVKRMFRWGVPKDLVPIEVLQRLETVPGLAKDRTDARESDPVEPVDDETVGNADAIYMGCLGHLPTRRGRPFFGSENHC